MRSSASAAVFAAAFLVIPPAYCLAQNAGVGLEPQASTAPAGEDPSLQVFAYRDVQGVLGKEVTSRTGENVGRIVQVLVDQTGQVRGAVIDFGGFMGVGSRKIVVDWAALHFAPAGEHPAVILDFTRDQIKAAPEYQDGKPVVVLSALAPPIPDM